MKVHPAGPRLILAGALAIVMPGCVGSGHTVRVMDAVSGMPVREAVVVPLYPSFNGKFTVTDGRGIAPVAGPGMMPLPTVPYHVEITATGYQKQSISISPGGPASSARRLEVILTPSRER